MTLTAPYSKHKKTNLIIFAGIMIVCASWFYYDGYHNQEFIEKHSNSEGKPDSTLAFNKKSPPFFLIGAAACGVLFFIIKGKKIVLDDEKIVAPGKTVKYSSIQKIDKTHFASKGYFILTYKDEAENMVDWKISASQYDGLSAVLDAIVAKIS